jgi:hypothetical protein
LQIVDDDRNRLLLAQVRQKTSDSQRYSEGVDLLAVRFDPPQRNREGTLLWNRKASVRPLRALGDQLGESGKRQSSLELRRGDRKHPAPPALGQLIEDPQQAALSRTRVTGCDGAPTTDQDIAHHLQSVLPAEQPEGGSRHLVHGVIIAQLA